MNTLRNIYIWRQIVLPWSNYLNQGLQSDNNSSCRLLDLTHLLAWFHTLPLYCQSSKRTTLLLHASVHIFEGSSTAPFIFLNMDACSANLGTIWNLYKLHMQKLDLHYCWKEMLLVIRIIKEFDPAEMHLQSFRTEDWPRCQICWHPWSLQSIVTIKYLCEDYVSFRGSDFLQET